MTVPGGSIVGVRKMLRRVEAYCWHCWSRDVKSVRDRRLDLGGGQDGEARGDLSAGEM